MRVPERAADTNDELGPVCLSPDPAPCWIHMLWSKRNNRKAKIRCIAQRTISATAAPAPGHLGQLAPDPGPLGQSRQIPFTTPPRLARQLQPTLKGVMADPRGSSDAAQGLRAQDLGAWRHALHQLKTFIPMYISPLLPLSPGRSATAAPLGQHAPDPGPLEQPQPKSPLPPPLGWRVSSIRSR